MTLLPAIAVPLFLPEEGPVGFMAFAAWTLLSAAFLVVTLGAVALVRPDTVRVTQIFNNLASNAITFTPELGDVTLRAFADGDAVRCEAEDTGMGIPEETLGHLFTRFYQVDSTLHRSAKGLGLGLAITKSLVEGHGGTIGVESVPGSGSLFWFTVPVVGAAVEMPVA